MVASIVLWLVARHFGWNFSAYPAGTWYFNPFCWQVLFVFGSWCALGGARKSMAIINSPITLYFCIAYLILGLVMTMAGKFPDFGEHVPALALFDLQPERQDQSGALPLPAFRGDRDPGHPLRAEGLARAWNGKCSIRSSSAVSNRWPCSASACSCRSSDISNCR